METVATAKKKELQGDSFLCSSFFFAVAYVVSLVHELAVSDAFRLFEAEALGFVSLVVGV